MDLLLILLLVFVAVALMIVLGERFAKPSGPQQLAQLRRWLIPLVGAALVLSILNFYWG